MSADAKQPRGAGLPRFQGAYDWAKANGDSPPKTLVLFSRRRTRRRTAQGPWRSGARIDAALAALDA